MIRTLIVDDEPPARDHVREFLSTEIDVAVIGESADGEDALRQIDALKPDLLLMDIRMPRVSGLDVLRRALVRPPYTIFITAYASHAVEAFAVEALDYLVKPLQRQRFGEAIARARRFLARHTTREPLDPDVLRRFCDGLSELAAPLERLSVKVGRKTVIVDVSQVEYVEADGDYATLHHTNGALTRTRDSITSLESRLPAKFFARVHRSLIVNLRYVDELRSNKRGGFYLTTTGGNKLATGPKYGMSLRKLLVK